MNNTLYIKWEKSNELGISIIDEQHKGVVSTINSLYYFIQDGHGFDVLEPILRMLVQYTNIHFQTEEDLLKKSQYPKFEEHCSLHKELLKRTIKISKEALKNHEPELALKFLKNWWIGHINGEDKKYAVHVKKVLGIQ